MTGLLASCGVWLEDEIQASTDPAAHADGIITTMQRERIGWVATNVAVNGASMALNMLQDATARHRYGSAGYWNQNMAVEDFLRHGERDGAQLMIANIESRDEDRWDDEDIDWLAVHWPDYHAGVCWTEAAYGKHPDGTYNKENAARWHDGIVSMPEAIQSENPAATIPAMLYVNNQYGFAHQNTSTVIYLTRGYDADQYPIPAVQGTGGRWSLFRYGDLDPGDWGYIRTWPRPTTAPKPQPPEKPMPKGSARSAYAAMDYWFNATATPPDWRKQNPGEWQAVQAYRAAPPGTLTPTVTTNTGRMLISLLEAAKWAEGTHA